MSSLLSIGAELHQLRLQRLKPKWRTCDIGHSKTIEISEKAGVHIGSITWEGSLILLSYLQEHLIEEKTSRLNILELGAGVGYLGIGLLATFPQLTVTLTEKGSIENQLLQENLDCNSSLTDRGTIQKLEWGVDVVDEDQQYDIIVAADVLYSESCVKPLFKTVSQLLLKKQCCMYLAYKKRDEEAEATFFQLCSINHIDCNIVHEEGKHSIYYIKKSSSK